MSERVQEFTGSEPFVRAMAAIARERERQTSRHGWTPEHDDEHEKGELALAGASYAVLGGLGFMPITAEMQAWFLRVWPFEGSPRFHGAERDLAIAGALIVAELERRFRAKDRAEAER